MLGLPLVRQSNRAHLSECYAVADQTTDFQFLQLRRAPLNSRFKSHAHRKSSRNEQDVEF